MLRELNLFLQNIYKIIVPKRIQLKLTPQLMKFMFLINGIIVNKKKKRLDYVEVRITDHCNLKCKSCGQFSPLADPIYVDITTFTNDFKRIYKLTEGDIKTIRLMGGEPLLHPQLPELMHIIRTIFNKSHIILVTNGILLSSQNEKFWNICKNNNIEILISHYPINIKYKYLIDISKKHNVKLNYATKKPQFMFKWVFDINGKQDPKRNFYRCYFGNNCIQVDNGRLFNCPIIPCVKHFNAYFNKNMPVKLENSIDIYKNDLKQILSFLASPVPFCAFCCLDEIEYGKTWESSKREISEWT